MNESVARAALLLRTPANQLVSPRLDGAILSELASRWHFVRLPGSARQAEARSAAYLHGPEPMQQSPT